MPSSALFTFTDPVQYQTAIRGAQVEFFPLTKGDLQAELTHVTLDRIWMQRSHTNLPMIRRGRINPDRAAIRFMTNWQKPAYHCGMQMTPADIAFETGDSSHARTNGGSDAGSMSLTWQDLAAASKALTGCELTIPLVAHLVRPKPELMSRLLTLHKTAGELAKTASGILAHTEVARSLEQALVRAMIMCLADGVPALPAATGRRHSVVIARLEEFLAANWDRAIYLAELCAATGASERTLRLCCQEHLGMGPIRYLQLRRLHLARRALMRARSGATTVTEIATEFGFWELGRFSVEYRALFGETPSVTLYRAPDDYWTTKNHSLALPVPEFA